MKRVKKLAIGLFLLGHAISGAAFSAPVTLAGNTVDFNFDDTLLGLFGPANVSGDSIYFTPVGFAARSTNGAGYDFSNATMNIKVTAREGWSFSGIGLVERGDYLLLGAGNSAAVAGQIRVFDIARPLTDITASIASLAPMTTVGLPTHNWSATAFANVASLDARAINVTIENLLLASTSMPGSLAFVEKKFVGLTPVMTAVTPVPEAETYAMMLAGLGLVGWAARRRRALGNNT